MNRLTPLMLSQAGFDQESIINFINQQRPLLKYAGFSDMEINEAYGVKQDVSSVISENDVKDFRKIDQNARKQDKTGSMIRNTESIPPFLEETLSLQGIVQEPPSLIPFSFLIRLWLSTVKIMQIESFWEGGEIPELLF